MAFADPEMMAHEYLAEEGKRYDFNEYIVDQMSKYKTEAVKRFYIIAHPDYAEALASTTAYGYENDLPEAAKIVQQLLLNDKHIAALNDDARKMNEILSQENYEDQEFYSFGG